MTVSAGTLASMFDEAIGEFWSWWVETGAVAVAEAIASEEETDLPAQISERVSAIHPALEWQLTDGVDAAHSLALSAGGTRALRAVTERWLELAPDADGTWEYHPARIPVALGPFPVDGTTIDPAAVSVATEWDATYEQLDVELHIPGTEDFDDAARSELALYLLDATLGEDDTERWVGLIDIVDERPRAAVGLAGLSDLVKASSELATGDGWVATEHRLSKKETVVATVNVSLKHVDHLRHVFHLEVRIQLNEYTNLGMPTDEEAAAVDAVEDELFDRLPDDVLFVGRETGVGQRIMHFYGPDPDRLEHVVEPWASDHPTHDISFDLVVDPEWTMVDRLT